MCDIPSVHAVIRTVGRLCVPAHEPDPHRPPPAPQRRCQPPMPSLPTPRPALAVIPNARPGWPLSQRRCAAKLGLPNTHAYLAPAPQPIIGAGWGWVPRGHRRRFTDFIFIFSIPRSGPRSFPKPYPHPSQIKLQILPRSRPRSPPREILTHFALE